MDLLYLGEPPVKLTEDSLQTDVNTDDLLVDKTMTYLEFVSPGIGKIYLKAIARYDR